jgi:ABC-type nitrate/sulfonate/bicarbonate transport system substrate-binding protein
MPDDSNKPIVQGNVVRRRNAVVASNKSNSGFKLKIIAVSIALLIAVAFISVWARKPPEQEPGGLYPLRVSQSTAPTTFEIANKLTGRDILADHGIKELPVVIQGGEGGTITMQALLANQIDVSGGSISIWVNAVNQGAKVRLVAVTNTTQNPDYSGMLVLEDSDIHEIKDLAGKKIAINVLGAEAEFVMRTFLPRGGLSWDDLQVVILTAAQQEQALRSKQVDAAIWTSSGGIEFDRAMDAGGVRKVPGTSSHEARGKKMVNTSQGFREDFIAAHPDVVRGFVAASDAAIRAIWNAYKKDPEKVQRIYAEIAEEKGSNPELAKYYREPRWAPENQTLHDDDIQFWIDNLEANGTIEKGKVKPSDVYTNEFFPNEPIVLDILD